MGFFLPSRSLSPLATECCYFVNLFCLPPGTAAAALMAKKKVFRGKTHVWIECVGRYVRRATRHTHGRRWRGRNIRWPRARVDSSCGSVRHCEIENRNGTEKYSERNTYIIITLWRPIQWTDDEWTERCHRSNFTHWRNNNNFSHWIENNIGIRNNRIHVFTRQ